MWYKIIKRDLLKKYNLVGKYQDIAMETTLRPLKDGATIKEVPTVWKRKIGDKTYLNLSYIRSFSLTNNAQIGVEYKLNRHFSVVGNIDDMGNLNVKYRYRYAY